MFNKKLETIEDCMKALEVVRADIHRNIEATTAYNKFLSWSMAMFGQTGHLFLHKPIGCRQDQNVESL